MHYSQTNRHKRMALNIFLDRNAKRHYPKPLSQNMEQKNHGMYSVTGLYAPAGEVIKVEISEQDMNTTGGIIIHIGQALYNSKANNIWLQKGQMQRFPVILNTMVVLGMQQQHQLRQMGHKEIRCFGCFHML